MKRLVSGIQPSGTLHIGNYFGAMKQFVDLQNEYDCTFIVVDLHALTTLHDASLLRENIRNVFIDYLAVGLDPKRSLIFKQSDAPQVTELTWIFNCLTTIPYLERAHAFKDKVANQKIPSVGLFDYPVLMASDILLPEAEVVPVGQDQKQHVEMTREIAQKFNNTFGETFKLPREFIRDDVAVVPGIDGRKMSKSYGNDIPLFAEEDDLKNLAMSVVTDSTPKGEPIEPENDNVFALHKLVASEDELRELEEAYRSGSIGYKESKELLFERLNRFIAPLREKRHEIASNQTHIESLIKEGGEKAYERYEKKMEEVREKVGLK
jgi:tryptophanyl-tRNA synthetase